MSESERAETEAEKEQLQEAKTLLKIEEQKLAAKERKVLDSIEVEMEMWEKHKKEELKKFEQVKNEIARECRNADLDRLSGRVEEKESVIHGMKLDLKQQAANLVQYEEEIAERVRALEEEREEVEHEVERLQGAQCRAVIALDRDIIAVNDQLEEIDNKLTDDLRDIQEEREGWVVRVLLTNN